MVALGLVWIMPSERLSRLQWIGLALSFVGVALALRVSAASRDMLIGDALSLVAGVLWGATTLIIKGTRLRNAQSEKMLLYQLVVSVFILAPFALWRGETFPTHISLMTAAAFAYQTIWVVGVTFVVWLWMIKTLSRRRIVGLHIHDAAVRRRRRAISSWATRSRSASRRRRRWSRSAF